MAGRSAAALGLAAVAVVSVGAAWRQDVPDLTRHDAVVAMEDALEQTGLDASVEPDPEGTTYASRTRDRVEVWAVHASIRAQPIELLLARAGGDPVSIDDRNRDGSDYVLSEREFTALASSVDDPARRRTIRRIVALTVAAVLVIVLALAHAATTPKEPA